jgi:glycosyltransferase involved in cell wall biosynthesis
MRLMARGLARAGCEVHVATTDDNGPERLAVPLGIPVIDEGVSYWHFRRQTSFYGFSWPLTRWLARHIANYDLVHIHALFSYAALPAAYWARRRRIPYVVRPLGTLNRWGMANRHRWLKRLSFALLERRLLARAACIHYTSEQERIEAAELGVLQRSVVVPLGIEFDSFAALPARGWLRARAPHLDGRTVALFLSRVDPKKGLDLLIPALAAMKSRGVPLTLVVAGQGEPMFEATLRREAARLEVESEIVWAGFVRGRDKLSLLADADLFVLPSYSENFGVAVVEAMAAGLPVVVSDQVGIHREVEATGAGTVVPCRVEDLAGALTRLVTSPGARREMGARARGLAGDCFSLDRMTTRLVELYEEILRGAPAEVSG